MTEKQKKFADEYLIDLNATRAYKAAYKSVKNDNSAAVNASKLLRNTKVAAYIEEKIAERSERTEIKQDDVVKYPPRRLRRQKRGKQNERRIYTVKYLSVAV